MFFGKESKLGIGCISFLWYDAPVEYSSRSFFHKNGSISEAQGLREST